MSVSNTFAYLVSSALDAPSGFAIESTREDVAQAGKASAAQSGMTLEPATEDVAQGAKVSALTPYDPACKAQVKDASGETTEISWIAAS